MSKQKIEKRVAGFFKQASENRKKLGLKDDEPITREALIKAGVKTESETAAPAARQPFNLSPAAARFMPPGIKLPGQK